MTHDYIKEFSDKPLKNGSLSSIPTDSPLNIFLKNPPYKDVKGKLNSTNNNTSRFYFKGIDKYNNFFNAVADLYNVKSEEIIKYILQTTQSNFNKLNIKNLEIIFRNPFFSSLQNFFEYTVSELDKNYLYFIDLLTNKNALIYFKKKKKSIQLDINKPFFIIIIKLHKINDNINYEIQCPYYRKLSNDNQYSIFLLIDDKYFHPIYLHNTDQQIKTTKFFTDKNSQYYDIKDNLDKHLLKYCGKPYIRDILKFKKKKDLEFKDVKFTLIDNRYSKTTNNTFISYEHDDDKLLIPYENINSIKTKKGEETITEKIYVLDKNFDITKYSSVNEDKSNEVMTYIHDRATTIKLLKKLTKINIIDEKDRRGIVVENDIIIPILKEESQEEEDEESEESEEVESEEEESEEVESEEEESEEEESEEVESEEEESEEVESEEEESEEVESEEEEDEDEVEEDDPMIIHCNGLIKVLREKHVILIILDAVMMKNTKNFVNGYPVQMERVYAMRKKIHLI